MYSLTTKTGYVLSQRAKSVPKKRSHLSWSRTGQNWRALVNISCSQQRGGALCAASFKRSLMSHHKTRQQPALVTSPRSRVSTPAKISKFNSLVFFSNRLAAELSDESLGYWKKKEKSKKTSPGLIKTRIYRQAFISGASFSKFIKIRKSLKLLPPPAFFNWGGNQGHKKFEIGGEESYSRASIGLEFQNFFYYHRDADEVDTSDRPKKSRLFFPLSFPFSLSCPYLSLPRI